ncbi:MAG: OsmC family protein [Phenylobacterium sp.]|uniref:OsmC family protein n=1 Tax=Phenylobacterium sp. TaxID=1871053 RepID=UPI0027168A92|nr:OsmC family protein [Phenylobacterium sp.]MDO8911946.1 OsmC family protein [Phenylobacterium sp.]MDP3102936.1 OsmC family protein [Phenylobacterium sp.]HQT54295.1 OsmC family protein [Phenylobacterium sp.]
MAKYVAEVLWTLKDGEDFLKGRYSRGHSITFDGGVELAASASPHVVGKWAVEAAVDPEEMMVAALSNCHMLTFLHRARLAGFLAVRYQDAAEGIMEEVRPGRQALTRVWLRPVITWQGDEPTAEQLAQLHHEAHDECFIANSVKTQVMVEARAAA